ncbi:hypothetical protein [Leifsonia sp. TF02-11]|uniref:hypothetical protein n=1 Tax=Leifsonia sp. TF02-11 TaxID=2815212 RepID=UPI001AA14C02|nr:hypothetical protein [Leifsonia sp. TF02-11]MBO1737211.1 hypothetical protein [Leifsonia sp. TF02-11]
MVDARRDWRLISSAIIIALLILVGLVVIDTLRSEQRSAPTSHTHSTATATSDTDH